MQYVRTINFDDLERSDPDKHWIQKLYNQESGAEHCTINCIKTPPGSGSPAGLHYHDIDQIFYILRGSMSVEIKGEQFRCGPGTFVIFPAGTPHRNWNETNEPIVHIAFNTPLPEPEAPFSKPV